MKNIKILDCTLRDGGRLFNCEFSDEMIKDMQMRLDACKVDIIEIGFLRDSHTVSYSGNSTFFTDTKQIELLVDKQQSSAMIVAFIDYGMYDFSDLNYCDGKSIEGIRFGFTHKNWYENRGDILRCMKLIKNKGYKLFVQNVNTPGYSDFELLDLINACNEIKPFSYGIVDTYGSMYIEDIKHYYDLVDRNLSPDICIDFHSHNNYQLSFALAQEVIYLSDKGERVVIIDATLNGMGKGAGNLNEELVIEYLVRRKNYNYDVDGIFDIIDDYLKEIKRKNTWGYSVPAMLSGIYKAHPNNMLYLTEKYDLSSRDIRVILAMEKPEERERYNYERLNQLCEDYRSTKINDTETIEELKEILKGRTILLAMPGATIKTHLEEIECVIEKYNPVILSVNFYFDPKRKDYSSNYQFFGSADRYRMFWSKCDPKHTIISSSISSRQKEAYVVNYEGLVERINDHFDVSAILALNLLKKCNVKKIFMAGFDGYNDNTSNYYEKGEFQSDLVLGEANKINQDIQEIFTKFCKSINKQIELEFITPTRYVIPDI